MKIDGFDEDVYYVLSKYCKDLGRNNPENAIVLEFTTDEDDSRFQCIFIYYNTSVIDFIFCYSILGLDRTHLNTKYKDI